MLILQDLLIDFVLQFLCSTSRSATWVFVETVFMAVLHSPQHTDDDKAFSFCHVNDVTSYIDFHLLCLFMLGGGSWEIMKVRDEHVLNRVKSRVLKLIKCL